MTTPLYLEKLEPVIQEVIAPMAADIDSQGMYPRPGLVALGKAGLLGLVSAPEVGGMGEGIRAAAMVVERVARECASTGMVLCMHYCATAIIEKYGPLDIRQAIAKGEHITTLAFSELGSRSHFWAPVSTVSEVDGAIHIHAQKSWSTSAGQADSYVWSSRPLAVTGESTLWLVPGKAEGLKIPAPFNGLGLRGNYSSPIAADGVKIEKSAMLGGDSGGFDIMMGIVLPYFQVISAACYLGLTESATAKAIAHVSATKFQYAGAVPSLADLPTIRAYLARMRMKTDMGRALLLDTLTAMESGREDTMLRVLEIKAAMGEVSTEVTDIAMRVCGGAAYRKEVGIERHFRDARAATVMSPTTDLLYDFIGKAICGLPLF